MKFKISKTEYSFRNLALEIDTKMGCRELNPPPSDYQTDVLPTALPVRVRIGADGAGGGGLLPRESDGEPWELKTEEMNAKFFFRSISEIFHILCVGLRLCVFAELHTSVR